MWNKKVNIYLISLILLTYGASDEIKNEEQYYRQFKESLGYLSSSIQSQIEHMEIFA